MNNDPVAYLHKDGSFIRVDPRIEVIDPDLTPLYTHPDEHALGIAEAIGFDKGYQAGLVKEQPTKEDEFWLMVLVLREKVKEQQAEIEALKDRLMLAQQSLSIVENWVKG